MFGTAVSPAWHIQMLQMNNGTKNILGLKSLIHFRMYSLCIVLKFHYIFLFSICWTLLVNYLQSIDQRLKNTRLCTHLVNKLNFNHTLKIRRKHCFNSPPQFSRPLRNALPLLLPPEPVWLPGPQFQHGGHAGEPSQRGLCSTRDWRLPPTSGPVLMWADWWWILPWHPGRPSLQWNPEEAGLPKVKYLGAWFSSRCRTR